MLYYTDRQFILRAHKDQSPVLWLLRDLVYLLLLRKNLPSKNKVRHVEDVWPVLGKRGLELRFDKTQRLADVCKLVHVMTAGVCVVLAFFVRADVSLFHTHGSFSLTKALTAVSVSVAVLSSHSTSCLSLRPRWIAGALP